LNIASRSCEDCDVRAAREITIIASMEMAALCVTMAGKATPMPG
jgi:hypothetical protein